MLRSELEIGPPLESSGCFTGNCRRPNPQDPSTRAEIDRSQSRGAQVLAPLTAPHPDLPRRARPELPEPQGLGEGGDGTNQAEIEALLGGVLEARPQDSTVELEHPADMPQEVNPTLT